MKLLATIFIATLLLGSSTITDHKNDLAKVKQVEGLYLFIYSEPVNDYVYLGTVKGGFKWTGEPSEMLPKLLKKAHADYPNADGLIINSDMDRAEIIKFE